MSKEPGLVFNDLAQATDYEITHCYPAQIARKLGYTASIEVYPEAVTMPCLDCF